MKSKWVGGNEVIECRQFSGECCLLDERQMETNMGSREFLLLKGVSYDHIVTAVLRLRLEKIFACSQLS